MLHPLFSGLRYVRQTVEKSGFIHGEVVNAIKLIDCCGCHSLRKTFGYLEWKAGVLPVMLTDIFNHSSFEITRRYLGISQDDRDKVYLKLEIL